MKRETRMNLLILLLVALGLGVMFFPSISDWYYRWQTSREIAQYNQVAEAAPEDYSQLWEAAEAYNRRLAEGGLFSAGVTPEEQAEVEQLLNPLGTGMMGYVDIPKIDVHLPIYQGIEEQELQSGAGWWIGTSLPTGGESTHCVITAHNGLVRAKMFTELDQLEEGDTFSLSILDRVLTYEVDQVLVAMPTDIEALSIVEGQDYVTLYTCTPTGVNTHRLLVRGHRIPTPEAEEEAASSPETSSRSGGLSPVLPAVGALAVFAALAVGLMDRLRKRRGAAYQPKRLRGTAPKKSKGLFDRINQRRQKTGGPDKPPENKDLPRGGKKRAD